MNLNKNHTHNHTEGLKSYYHTQKTNGILMSLSGYQLKKMKSSEGEMSTFIIHPFCFPL